jgi:L-alanine-DL-glutamate epimerase-like enolase superfamily enzyme
LAVTIDSAAAHLLRYQLKQAVGGSGVSFVDVIVVDVTDSEGLTGLGVSYVLAASGTVARHAALEQLDKFVSGKPLVPPQASWRTIAASFNRTGLGPNLIGLAAIDVALWDLHAKRLNIPLGVAMGGEPRLVDVYGSGGFTAGQSPSAAAETTASHLERGFKAVKPRVSGDPSDAPLLRAVRAALGDAAHLMADANEKCDISRARWLLQVAGDQGVLFVEEPLPASEVAGYRALAQHGVGIATGEHFQSRESFVSLMTEGAVAVIQPDLAMVGGLTPVLELCTVANALNVAVSPHFFPGLFVHVAAAAPNLKWLEDFPLLEPLFDGWPAIGIDGRMKPGTSPGHGLTLQDEFRAAL